MVCEVVVVVGLDGVDIMLYECWVVEVVFLWWFWFLVVRGK